MLKPLNNTLHLLYCENAAGYPKKLQRSSVNKKSQYSRVVEVSDLSASLDGGLDPNTTWSESECIEEKSSDYKSEVCWQSFSTPLHRALRLFDHQSVELLLRRGADINIYNATGLTPLHEAVRRGEHEQMKFLFEHGCDVDKPAIATPVPCENYPPIPATNQPNLSCTQIAVLNADNEVLNLLLDAGASQYLSPLKRTWTVLDLALLASDFVTIRMLLARGLEFSTDLADKSKIQLQSQNWSQQSAEHLLAMTTCNSVSPAECHYSTYVHTLHQVQKSHNVKPENDDEEEVIQFIRGFFDTLHLLASGELPTATKFCARCLRLQIEPAKCYHVPEGAPPLLFSLEKTHSDIEKSAAAGCLLCAKIADHLDYRLYEQKHDGRFLDPPGYKEQRIVSFELRPGGSSLRSVSIDTVCENDRLQRLEWATLKETTLREYDIGRLSDSHTGSEGSIRVAKRWLNRCKSNPDHLVCQTAFQGSSETRPMPKRLLYISEDTVCVMNTNNIHSKYCALSYCWGKEEFIKTTKDNLAQHQKEVPLARLPIMIKQAIEFALKLDYQYIWIDALCIVQDDDAEWEQEAARMDSIYSHADLTLSSLVSASVSDPLFTPRIPRTIRPLVLDQLWKPKWARSHDRITTLFVPEFDYPGRWDPRPVHSRGWTLQEQLLSTRIIFFGEGLLHFECLLEARKEDDLDNICGRESRQYSGRENRIMAKRTLKGTLDQAKDKTKGIQIGYYNDVEGPFELWQEQFAEYTCRNLTRPSDRLAAFYSISSKMADVVNQKFVDGIWLGSEMMESLCWKTVRAQGRAVRNQVGFESFPSWSWVSVPGQISFAWAKRYGRKGIPITDEAQVISLNASAPDLRPLGKFANELVSIAFKTTLFKKEALSPELIDFAKSTSHDVHRTDNLGLSFDSSYESVQQNGSIYSFALFSFPRGPLDQSRVRSPRIYKDGKARGELPAIFSMLVQRVTGTTNQFRRVGMAVVPGVDEATLEDDESAAADRAETGRDMYDAERTKAIVTAWVNGGTEVHRDYILELL